MATNKTTVHGLATWKAAENQGSKIRFGAYRDRVRRAWLTAEELSLVKELAAGRRCFL